MKSLVRPTYSSITTHAISSYHGLRGSRPISEDEVHRTIGANALIGYTPVVYIENARGERLTSRDGRPMSIATLHGSTGVVSVFEFQES